jgi:aspartate aminotransferase
LICARSHPALALRVFSRLASSVTLPDVTKLFEAPPPGTIDFGLGEPDFQPPAEAVEGLRAAIAAGKNKYTSTLGVPELRHAIAKRLQAQDRSVKAEHVLITASGTHALALAAQALYADGDEVLVPDPGFFYYRPHARMMGAKDVPYALTDENEFMPDLDEIARKITRKTKAIVVNSPSNPTGASFDRATVKGIADLANDKEVVVVTDEVYSDLVYDGAFESFLGRVDNLVYTNSFSKTYALTGWRIGYAVARPPIFGEHAKMFFYHMACVAEPIQYGALAALSTPQEELDRRRAVFRKRRDTVVKSLAKVPSLRAVKPRGAFYAFPRFSTKKAMTSNEYATALLKGGVKVTAGAQFGAQGEGHIRLSYVLDPPRIQEGVERIARVAEKLA